MPNGREGDHPLTDILNHGLRVFTPQADALVREIVGLGGEEADQALQSLLWERRFDLRDPERMQELEQILTQMRDRLRDKT